ncbi:MAG: 50S ribosomal protein L11 methyltransferase [Flavobacteriaceae bacterium]|nr:50S ribosomal protein L11 methyltransferase [Flavobacteriaceae bacterium]
MDNSYFEYKFIVNPKDPATEILIAELANAGFESFVENDSGLLAYIQQKDWNDHVLDNIQILRSKEFDISYQKNAIEQTNWNKKWETNFEPIQVDDIVSIRAPFHINSNLKFDIVIEPKMSFGTGHHETTYMMVQQLIELNLENKKVLDMGCGTGILAIFSELKGAGEIDAIDIDEWCYENSIENCHRNNCEKINVYQGDAILLEDKKYDIIIANINRNILLMDIKSYAKCLNEKGILLLSGFYKEDIPIIDAEAGIYKLKLEKIIEKNNWVALKYVN